MRALEFLTGHVLFKLRYNQIFQMKTTLSSIKQILFSSFHRGDQRKKNQKLVNALFYVSL